MDTIWIKLIGGLLLVGGVFYAGWHEASIIKDAEFSSYKAQVAQASANQIQANAQLQIKQSQETLKSEQDHEKSISAIHSFYANLLQQRKGNGSNSVPTIPHSPRKLDDVPTQCLPLASSASVDIQQLIDLQNWIRQQQSLNLPIQ